MTKRWLPFLLAVSLAAATVLAGCMEGDEEAVEEGPPEDRGFVEEEDPDVGPFEGPEPDFPPEDDA